MSSFVFIILIGASMFSLVFRGFEGDDMISNFLTNLPGGEYGALFVVMITIFLLGFFLDYIEIIFVIIPLVGPGLIANGADPLWLGILISLNLDNVTSRVGPLPESLSKCISSDTKQPTSDNHEGLCLISESALSDVDTIISYLDNPLALS